MKRARRLGAILQGLVIGTLLVLAVCGLLALFGAAEVFTYQGF